jgi:hypothetical protein
LAKRRTKEVHVAGKSRAYPKEFREDAVRLYRTSGKTLAAPIASTRTEPSASFRPTHCASTSSGVACVSTIPFTGSFFGLGEFKSPAIRFFVNFDADGNVSVDGTNFPSLEVWAYGPGGQAAPLFFYDARTAPFGPFQLYFFGPLPNMF